MKEFERALLDARSPDLPVAEFRQALRRDLLREESVRQTRRLRATVGSLAAGMAVLLATVGLFIAKPSLPRSLNAALLHDPGTHAVKPPAADVAGMDPSGLDLRQLVMSEDNGADPDRDWIDRLYAGEPGKSGVKSSRDERYFALRRYELFSGKQVVVFTEIGSTSPEEARARIIPVRQF